MKGEIINETVTNVYRYNALTKEYKHSMSIAKYLKDECGNIEIISTTYYPPEGDKITVYGNVPIFI